MRCPSLDKLPVPSDKTGWPWAEETPQLPKTMIDGFPWPKVTIVTPSYNQTLFIEETIRSILLQGYPRLEYIIIDGGSTDNSLDIIRHYDRYLAYWESKPDLGQSHAINKGWKRATGDIVAYLNSDDTYEPGAIAAIARFFVNNPEADMVYGDCYQINHKSERIGTFLYKGFDLARLLDNDTWHIPQQGVFIKKEILSKVGLLDESLHFKMDRDLFIRIARAGNVKRIPCLSGCCTSLHQHQSAYPCPLLTN